MTERTRVAVVVFADVDGEVVDAHHVVERMLRKKLGDCDGTEHAIRVGAPDSTFEVHVRFHDAMEAGLAAGNGYLWTAPTRKAFRRLDDDD